MKLTVLESGSSGNCYLLSTENETLILDCGISIKEIKKGLDFNISKVVGVICSHKHSDHNKALNDFRNMGIHIMAPYEIGNVKKSHCRMGSFEITSFDLPHNGVWNSGFLIKVDGQKLLYMTDFEYCEYVFKKQKVNHILIECNYQQTLIERDLPNYEHKVRGHCSLDTCKGFIEVNRTSELMTVVLCHLGRETCRAEECMTEIKQIAKCSVYVAQKGLEVELTKCPF